MRSNFIINLAASNEQERLKLAGCKTATGVNFTSPPGLPRPWMGGTSPPFCQLQYTANGGTSCAARKHLMRQAINVNCLNGQKLEHTLARTWTWIRCNGGGFEGVRGLPGAVVSTCIVNEISWCANPAWVNYANVLHAYIYLCPPVGRVCILYPGPGHSAMAAAERK